MVVACGGFLRGEAAGLAGTGSVYGGLSRHAALSQSWQLNRWIGGGLGDRDKSAAARLGSLSHRWMKMTLRLRAFCLLPNATAPPPRTPTRSPALSPHQASAVTASRACGYMPTWIRQARARSLQLPGRFLRLRAVPGSLISSPPWPTVAEELGFIEKHTVKTGQQRRHISSL